VIFRGTLSSACIRAGTEGTTRLAKWLASRPEGRGPMHVNHSERALLSLCRDVLAVFEWDDQTDDP
jgi:hypothetical protein